MRSRLSIAALSREARHRHTAHGHWWARLRHRRPLLLSWSWHRRFVHWHLRVKQDRSFANFLFEFLVVLQVCLNFIEVQVDQHTSDLWSHFTSLDSLYEVENGISNLLLHHRVISLN